jgi:hypothetical protein
MQTHIPDKKVGWTEKISRKERKNKNRKQSLSDPRRNTIVYESNTKNYASIIKPDSKQDIKSQSVVNETCEYKHEFIKSIRTRKRRVRNQIPKDRCSSIEAWEYAYFTYIIDLKNIFVEGVNMLGLDTNSVDFFSNFSNFIKDCSSGEITPYIQELNDYEENMYNNYISEKESFKD